MRQICGVDYNQDKHDACGQTFDDAERMTRCPHPLLQEADWREQINAWAMGQPTVTATNAGLRVIVVPVDGPPRIESIENNLASFQGLVDGYIEIFRLGNGLVCVLNKEGMHYYPKWGTVSLVGDELSRTESIHGQFVVCREVMTPEGAEFASLTESEAFQIAVVFKSRSVILA